jgi:hypothetical protein
MFFEYACLCTTYDSREECVWKKANDLLMGQNYLEAINRYWVRNSFTCTRNYRRVIEEKAWICFDCAVQELADINLDDDEVFNAEGNSGANTETAPTS